MNRATRQQTLPRLRALLVGVLALFVGQAIQAQELEPRTYSAVPVGVNFVAAGYAFNQGNVFLDPALPIRDLDGDVHLVFVRYIRSFDLFGRPSKVKVLVPWASGRWQGFLEDESRTRRASGTGDARIGFETIFLGAPALRKSEFASYEQRRVFGLC